MRPEKVEVWYSVLLLLQGALTCYTNKFNFSAIIALKASFILSGTVSSLIGFSHWHDANFATKEIQYLIHLIKAQSLLALL